MPRSNLGSGAATIFDEEVKSSTFNVELKVAVCHVLLTLEGQDCRHKLGAFAQYVPVPAAILRRKSAGVHGVGTHSAAS